MLGYRVSPQPLALKAALLEVWVGWLDLAGSRVICRSMEDRTLCHYSKEMEAEGRARLRECGPGDSNCPQPLPLQLFLSPSGLPGSVTPSCPSWRHCASTLSPAMDSADRELKPLTPSSRVSLSSFTCAIRYFVRAKEICITQCSVICMRRFSCMIVA